MSARKNQNSMRSVNLKVEHLESRLVPTASPLDTPVEWDVLAQDPQVENLVDSTEIQTTAITTEMPLAAWNSPLQVNQEKFRQLGASLVGSPEFLGNQVDVTFQRILGRSPGSGKSAWVNNLVDGKVAPEDLSSRFMASEEFLATMDHNAKNMIKFIFLNYLDRNPTDKGLEFWLSRLDGLSRYSLRPTNPGDSKFDVLTPPSDPDYATAKDPCFIGLAPSNRTPEQIAALKHSLEKVALEIQNSEESKSNSIRTLYNGILHRDPSEGEVAGWRKSGLRESALIQKYIESREFQNRFQNVQELIAGAYSEVLFRPAGAQGLRNWETRLGRAENGNNWISQIPGVEGFQGTLDDRKLDQILQLVYANGVTGITTSQLDYFSRFDPNLIARAGGNQIRANLPSEVRDNIPPGDRKAFWAKVGKGTWDAGSSEWNFTYEVASQGALSEETVEFSIDPFEPDDQSDFSGEMVLLEDYQLGSWGGFIHGVEGKLPTGWNSGGVIGDIHWSVNIEGGNDPNSWHCTLPVDPISPILPIDGFGSVFADLNGDGITDEIKILRGNFFGPGETEVQVFFGHELAKPDPEPWIPSLFATVGNGGANHSQGGLEELFSDWPVLVQNPYTSKPSYTIVPFKGFSGRVTVAAGDFDGDGRTELAIAPRDYDLFMISESAFPLPEGKPLVNLFQGLDGSLEANVPLPLEMVWKVWGTATDPASNMLVDQLVEGVDGIVVGAGGLDDSGRDRLLIATGGQNAQIWIGSGEKGETDPYWAWSWTTGPLAKGQSAHELFVADINLDGQADIGLNATRLADGPISVALYVPPETLWFDGKTFEPISFGGPGESLVAPDGKLNFDWFLGLFEDARTVVLDGGNNRDLLESLLNSVLPALPFAISNSPIPFLSQLESGIAQLSQWLSKEAILDQLLEIPEWNDSLEELRTILVTEDYKDRLKAYLDKKLSEFESVA